VLAFVVVVGLAAWASRWLAGQARGLQRPAFTLLGGVALGGQRQVCAVRVGRRVLVLGLGEKQISLLQTITDPEEIALLLPPPSPPPGGDVFRRILAAARRGGRTDA